VEEWEEPLHLRSLPGKLSHIAPQCNPNLTFFPTFPCDGPHDGQLTLAARPRGGGAGAAAGRYGESVQPHELQRPPRCASLAQRFAAEQSIASPALPAAATRKDQAVPPAQCPPAGPRALATARHAVTAALAMGTLVGVLAGCGSSHSTGTAAEPATAVPASAPLYAGAIVRPDGSLKSAALADGQALTHQADPYVHLVAALQAPGSPAIDYNRDVAPWLGTQAGIFLTSSPASNRSELGQLLSLLEQGLLGNPSGANAFPFGTHGVQGAIVMDTRDATRAGSFLDSEARAAGAHPVSYRGVTYQLGPGGVAFGVVDRFAVIGSEPGLRSVIDTTLGGPPLARAAAYSSLLASAPSGALAHVYASPGASPASARSPATSGSTGSGAGGGSTGSSAGDESQGLQSLLHLLAGGRTVNVSLVPSTTSISLDADALASGSTAASGGLLGSGSEGAKALGELPGESWLAIGLGNVGGTLGEDVQGLRGLLSLGSSTSENRSSTISVGGLLNGLLAPLLALGASDAEARRAFQSWMGPAGIFASGSGLLELKGAVVIASTNPSLSRAAVAKLAARLTKAGGSAQPVSVPGTEASVAVKLSGLPVALVIASGRDASGQSKFVIGLGEASVTAALNPSSTLSGSASYKAAAAALGEGIEPSLIVEVPTLLGLLEGVGLSEDPTISKFVPYLRSLTTLAGGGKSLSGGIERFRLVAGLQSTG